MSEDFSDAKTRWWIIGTFVVLSFIAFGASLSHGFSMIDDPYLVYQNLAIRGPTLTNLHHIFLSYDPELYVPVTLFSYQLNYLIAGLNAGFYHLTNILLHGLNGFLIAWLIALVTKKRNIALFAGLLWLVHPLNTEAVVWIAGRKDLLSTFFALLSTLGFLLWRKGDQKLYWWLSLGAFLLALMSKATVFTLPLVFLLLDFLEHRNISKKSLIKTIPFFLLSGIFLIIALFGKVRVVHASSFFETIVMAGKSTVFYLTKLIAPYHLTVFYPYEKAITLTSPDFFVPWIILLILIGIAMYSLRKTFRIAIPFLIFLILLAPTYFNFHKGEEIFFAVDRYAYLPSLGFFILLAFAAEYFQKITQEKLFFETAKRVSLAVPIALIVMFTALSMHQTAYWKSDEALLDHALAMYPESGPARLSLSVVYRQSGRIDEERKILEEGLVHMPTVAYYTGIGSVAARENKLDEAERNYNLGRALDPKNPEPLFYLGSLEEQKGNIDAAIKDYTLAIALDDSYVSAYNNLGGIYQDQNKLSLAEEQFRKALAQNPNFMEGQYNLFQILEMQKKNDEAFPYLVNAYALNPDSYDIAVAYAYRLMTRGRKNDAKNVLEKFLIIDPANTTAKRLLEQLK